MKALSSRNEMLTDDWTSHFCSQTVADSRRSYPFTVSASHGAFGLVRQAEQTRGRLEPYFEVETDVVPLDSPRRVLWAILGGGLTLRSLVIFVVFTRYSHEWLYSRGVEMGLLADSLVRGMGYSSPFGGSTGPSAFIAPGYPTLIAGVFLVFGRYSFASAIAIVLLQIFVGLLTIWLMICIARETMGERAANLAGAFWAVSIPLLWMPTIFWETSLSACLLTGMVLLTLRCRTSGVGVWALTGAYCGVTGLINPALLPSLCIMLGWTAWRTRRVGWRTPLLSAAAFVLVFAAWPIRNAVRFHAFIPLRSTVGFELWMGNRPGATGYLDESLFPMYNKAELASYVTQGEVAYTQGKSREATGYILQEPGVFIRMSFRRFLRFWTGTGNSTGSAVFALHACLTTILGIGGLVFLFRKRQTDIAVLMAIPLLLFPMPYYVTHAEFRYRLVIDPLLTMLAAYGIMQMVRSNARKLVGAQKG